ncbi:21767_t:CDS:2 [Gigaspora margarita]|uniref:21767_t:CDS:1 n=1 Tax=Gigaspora margarita TaxID=4874 RepID=A0ABN7WNH1_GIGMA|nr:21767_t:CDS:2 [Gigaspora margarita]
MTSFDEDFKTKYPLPRDFLSIIAKLKEKCIGDIESVTFKNDGSICVRRNVSKFEKNRKLRNRFGKYDVESVFRDLDSYSLLKENEIEQKKLKVYSLRILKVLTTFNFNNAYLIQLKENEIAQIDNSAESSNYILNQIFIEIGDKANEAEQWEAINDKLHSIFGYSTKLKNPSQAQKEKYLSWIFALRH